MTTVTDLPADAVERVMRARAAREEAAAEQAKRTIAAIREEHRRHRAAILPADVERALREHHVAAPRDSRVPHDAERLRRREAERARAASLGVDLAALARLTADTRERIAAVVRPPAVDGAVTPLPDDAAPPHVADLAVAAAPWHGSWDVGTSWWSTAGHRTTWLVDQSNYLPSANRSGSNLMFSHRQSDGDDDVFAQHTSGFLLNYTMPFTGRLSMTFATTRAFGRFFCDNDDEPGWSDCWTEAGEYGVAEVYWDWNDWEADAAGGQLLIGGVLTDDTEAWIDSPGIFPGSSRSVQLKTDVTFPQGHTVLVFMATRQAMLASLNDVSTTLGVDGAWYVSAPSVWAI
jgi:hypothetical protein